MLECSAGSIISVLVLLHVVTVSVDRTYNTHPNRKAGFWAKEVLLDLLGTKRWWPSDVMFPDRYTYTPVGEGSWNGYCLCSETSDGIEYAESVYRTVLAEASANGWGGADVENGRCFGSAGCYLPRTYLGMSGVLGPHSQTYWVCPT